MDAKKYLAKIGRQGGKKRAERHSFEQLSAWGKLGGRPKKIDKIREKMAVQNSLA